MKMDFLIISKKLERMIFWKALNYQKSATKVMSFGSGLKEEIQLNWI